MLDKIKPFRKQIKITIGILGIFVGINFLLAFFSMIFYNPSVRFAYNNLPNYNIFVILFIIAGFIMMPFAALEGEFRRQELLEAIKNKKQL